MRVIDYNTGNDSYDDLDYEDDFAYRDVEVIKWLFHYTNFIGYKGILKEKLIRVTPEDGKFAWFGEGVYMTALAPSVGRKQLLYNNHRKYETKDRNLLSKTFFYFKINFKHLPGVRKVNDKYNRDIYVFPNNINLQNVQYNHGHCDNYEDENTVCRYVLTSNGIQPPIPRPHSPTTHNIINAANTHINSVSTSRPSQRPHLSERNDTSAQVSYLPNSAVGSTVGTALNDQRRRSTGTDDEDEISDDCCCCCLIL